jgi:pimeloyl-ACP methyl ester carboxylesterase
MTMVVSQKQRIHYRFEGEKGAYLLLHHGLFGSHQDWYEAGYVEALRNDFRMILMDARGHGRSDHPLDPGQYRLQAFADDVTAIMDELDIRNLHFCGYSLGALVGFELLMRHPGRVRIVMLAGESPFLSEAVQTEWRQLAERIRAEGLGAVRERLVAEQKLVVTAPLPEQEGEQQAALALLEALASEPPRPDEGRISVDSPVALFTGEDDPALNRMRDARRRIHRARFVSFPGKTHGGLFHERTALVAEMLRLLRPGPKPSEGPAGQEGPYDDRSGHGGRGNRGHGRGGRGRDDGPRMSAPLTPPPPVDVPISRNAQVDTSATTPMDPGPPAEPWNDPSAAPDRSVAEAFEASADATAEPGTSGVAAQPWHEDRQPMPEMEGREAPPPLEDPMPEPPAAPQGAPDDIAVRARQEQEADEAHLPPERPAEPDDWMDPAELAPTLPSREAPASAAGESTDDDDEEDWREADEDEPGR